MDPASAIYLLLQANSSVLKRILALFFLFLLSPILRSQDRPFDVLHYDYTLRLRARSDSLSALALLDIQRKAPSVGLLKIDLTSFDGKKGMRVSRVAVNGKAIQRFQHRHDTLYIPIGKGIGRRFRVAIVYGGIPKDGLIIGRNQYGSRTFFGDNWPNRAHNWLACIDAPADKALFTFRVYAPAGYKVIANGTLKLERPSRHGALYVYQTQHPIPTKVASIGVATFAVERVARSPVPISSWVYPQNRDIAFSELRSAPEIVDFFSKRIAPFPFAKLADVQSTTRYGGMENAGCIFYNQNAFKAGQNADALIAHEVAHQWFGNAVTERDFRHLWLSEGFATYLTQLYLEKKYGADTLRHFLKKAQLQINAFKKRFPQAVLVPQKLEDPNSMLNVYSYQKGAWLLHMLRTQLGLKAFWAVLRKFYDTYRYANADTADFMRLLQAQSGRDFKQLFQLYAYSPELPRYRLRWRYHPKAQSVTGTLLQTQQNTGPIDFPIEVGIRSRKGQWVYTTLIPHRSAQPFVIKNIRHRPETVRLDPHYKVLKAL